MNTFLFSKLHYKYVVAASLVTLLLSAGIVYAVNTTTFSITISSTTLSVSIVDGSGTDVTNPSVAFGSYTRQNTCGTVTGTLGTSTQKVRISNPGAADGGWTLTIAASATTDVWTSGSNTFDFNDPGNSGSEGCSDKTSGDADSVGGQLTIDPSASTVAGVSSSSTTDITKGSSDEFDEGTTDAITLLTAAAGSDNFGTWDLTNVSLSQKIPSGQVASSGYSLNMTMTVTAQ